MPVGKAEVDSTMVVVTEGALDGDTVGSGPAIGTGCDDGELSDPEEGEKLGTVDSEAGTMTGGPDGELVVGAAEGVGSVSAGSKKMHPSRS